MKQMPIYISDVIRRNDYALLKKEASIAVLDAIGQREKAKIQGYTGDSCVECGSFQMVRNGSCLKCNSCGSTTGCS